MQEISSKQPKDKGSAIGTLLRVLFFLLAFIAIMFTILANMGGTSESLKKSVEDLVSTTLGGRPASVDRLVRISFFPLVGVDIEGLEVKESKENDTKVITADKLKMYMNFWSIATKSSTFSSLLVEKLNIQSGIIGRRSLEIEKMFVDHDKETKTAAIKANGKLGEHPWEAKIQVDVYGQAGGYSYSLGPNRNFSMEIEELNIGGILVERFSDYIKLSNITAGLPEKIIIGDLTLFLLENNLIKIKGKLSFGNNKSEIKPNIVIDMAKKPPVISGEIESDNLFYSDIIEGKNLQKFTARFYEIFDLAPIGWNNTAGPALPCAYDLDLKFNIAKLVLQDNSEKKNATFSIKQKDGVLNFIPTNIDIAESKSQCGQLDIFTARE